MTDVHSPAVRSKNLRAIRSKNTRPEIIIRQLLHASGFRYRLNVSSLPGKPDIVFPKYKAVIQVNGCFWHGHNCKFFKLPATRPSFWHDKININRANDKKSLHALENLGWRVATVWECAVRGKQKTDLDQLRVTLSEWLRSPISSCDDKVCVLIQPENT